jgi:hypothetical protein
MLPVARIFTVSHLTSAITEGLKQVQNGNCYALLAYDGYSSDYKKSGDRTASG